MPQDTIDNDIFVGGVKMSDRHLKSFIKKMRLKEYSFFTSKLILSFSIGYILIAIATVIATIVAPAKTAVTLCVVLMLFIFIVGGIIARYTVGAVCAAGWATLIACIIIILNTNHLWLAYVIVGLFCLGASVVATHLFNYLKATRIKCRPTYWKRDPALKLLRDTFEAKGGDPAWLQSEALKYGEITSAVDKYLESTMLMFEQLQLPSSYCCEDCRLASMSEYDRAEMEVATLAAIAVADYFIPRFLADMHIEVAAEDNRRESEIIEAKIYADREAFEDKQRDFIRKQNLEMSKNDVNTMIEGFSF